MLNDPALVNALDHGPRRCLDKSEGKSMRYLCLTCNYASFNLEKLICGEALNQLPLREQTTPACCIVSQSKTFTHQVSCTRHARYYVTVLRFLGISQTAPRMNHKAAVPHLFGCSFRSGICWHTQ